MAQALPGRAGLNAWAASGNLPHAEASARSIVVMPPEVRLEQLV
jgi:hypothetical protein